MQQGKNAAAFKAIKHVSKNIEIKEDANHDAIILIELQTKSAPGGPVIELDYIISGCPCRLREILLKLMAQDETFASVVLSAAEVHKFKTGASNDFVVDRAAFHHNEKIDPTKN